MAEASHEKKKPECLQLARLLKNNTPILQALRDETRQHIMVQMILSTSEHGQRVSEIAEIASLSRAAASRHVQILKNAGLLDVQKEGTRTYYRFSKDSKALEELMQLLSFSLHLLETMPEGCNENLKENEA